MERKGVSATRIHAENDSCASPRTEAALAQFLSDPRPAAQEPKARSPLQKDLR